MTPTWERAGTVLAAVLLVAACANRTPLAEDPFAVVRQDGGDVVAGASSALEGGGSAPGVAGGEAGQGAAEGGDGVAAAGSGSGSGPGQAAGGGQGAGGGATPSVPKNYDDGVGDTKVVFGSVSSASGLTDLLDPRPARAYFKFINASKGGINGRQLELRIYNDQFDTTRNAALTRQAVEQDKVFAFTASMAPLSSHGAKAYLEQRKIPVIGGELVNLQTWGQSPMFYPQSTLQSVAGGRLAGRYAFDIGCRRPAGLGATVAEADAWTVNFEKGVQDKGLNGFVYYARPSPADTDYNIYVAQMRAADADCVTVANGMPALARFRKALAQQRYFPIVVGASASYDPAYVESTQGQPRQNDYAFVHHDILENAGSNPAMRDFVENVSRFEPGVRQTSFGILAWAAAKTAAHAVELMGDDLTREHLFRVLDSLTSYDNGLTPPITWRTGPNRGPTCGSFVRLQPDGTWSTVARNYCLNNSL